MVSQGDLTGMSKYKAYKVIDHPDITYILIF
jgi:hypothetical protein